MIWGKSFCKTLSIFLLFVMVFSLVVPVGEVWAQEPETDIMLELPEFLSNPVFDTISAPTRFSVGLTSYPGRRLLESRTGSTPTEYAKEQGLKVAEGIFNNTLAQWIQYAAFWIIMQYNSLVIGISGEVFDFAMDKLVVNVEDFLTDKGEKSGTYDGDGPTISKAVEDLWSIFRDIGNLIIIFGLLYLAIKTIIEGNGFADKKVLASILVAAVLINFSLFFARAAFSLSNKVATEIFETVGIDKVNGVSFADSLKHLALPSLFFIEDGKDKILGLDEFRNSVSPSGQEEWALQNVIRALFGALILTMLAFVLIFGTFFLVLRFVVFLFLFITAGLGFTARFVGFTKKFGDMWWDNLIKHTISLPVFAFLFYIALTVTNTLSGRIYFGNIFEQGLSAIAPSILYYIVIIAFFAIAVMAPMTIGGSGSKQLGSFAGWGKKQAKGFGNYVRRRSLAAVPATAGVVGRQVGGRLVGDRWWSSEATKKKALEGNKGAQRKLAAGAWLQKRTFDARNVAGVGKGLGIGTAEKGGWAQRKKDLEKEQEKKVKEQHELYGVADAKKEWQKTDEYHKENINIVSETKRLEEKKKQVLELMTTTPDKNAADRYAQMAIDLEKEIETQKKKKRENDNKVLNQFKKVMDERNNKNVFTIQGLSNHFVRGRKGARGGAIKSFVDSQTKDKNEKNNDKLIAAIQASAQKTP